ncbi:MAG: hypothetical protein JO265_12390 [Acidimicrobiia bacterium]|nr:hypothetical protein [Acidimicrobiia bacterium]
MAAADGEGSPPGPHHGHGPSGELLTFPSGDTVRILLDSNGSGRALSVLDCTHVPGPTEPHVHADAHKSVFVLAGNYRFRVGADVIDAGPAEQVFVPRGVQHDFVVGIEGGRALFIFTPAGVEEYFRELAAAARAGSPAASVEELRRRHHIEPAPGPAGGTEQTPTEFGL